MHGRRAPATAPLAIESAKLGECSVILLSVKTGAHYFGKLAGRQQTVSEASKSVNSLKVFAGDPRERRKRRTEAKTKYNKQTNN